MFSQDTQGLLKANLVIRENLPQDMRIRAFIIEQHLENVYIQGDVSLFILVFTINTALHKIFDHAELFSGKRKQQSINDKPKFRARGALPEDGLLGRVVEIELVIQAVRQIKDADYELDSLRIMR